MVPWGTNFSGSQPVTAVLDPQLKTRPLLLGQAYFMADAADMNENTLFDEKKQAGCNESPSIVFLIKFKSM